MINLENYFTNLYYIIIIAFNEFYSDKCRETIYEVTMLNVKVY